MQTISFLFLQEQQLQSSEREYQLQIRQKVKLSCDSHVTMCALSICVLLLQEEQLTRKEAESTRTEETIRRAQQEMRQRVSLVCEVMCSVCCD